MFKLVGFIAAALIANAAQANAAVIYTYTGTLGSDLAGFPPSVFGRSSASSFSNGTLLLDVDFGLPRTLTLTALAPDFLAAHTLPPADLAMPTPVLYTIDIFTPSAPLTAGQSRSNDFWYNFYVDLGNGKWGNLGGADDIGADGTCCVPADPIDINGNVVTTSVLEKVKYTWAADGFVEFQWPGDIGIEETLDPADVGKPYFLEIFASAVPEPSTWAMLIMGFFGVGIMVRRNRRSPSGAC